MKLPEDRWERETYYLKGNNMTQHTKEPWGLCEDPDLQESDVIPPTGPVITIPWGNNGQRYAYYIFACVNACADINPEAVSKLLKACKSAVHELRKISTIGMTDTGDERLNLACNTLQAAIAKAAESPSAP